MKIEFDINDTNILYDVMDGIFVALLQRELRESKEYLMQFSEKYPDDCKMYKDNIKACKALLKFYGGKSEL